MRLVAPHSNVEKHSRHYVGHGAMDYVLHGKLLYNLSISPQVLDRLCGGSKLR